MFQLIIVSTKFQHKKIHKGAWVIPGTNDVNQTDHVLVNRRRMHTVTDVRSMKRPNCDSDRFLVRIMSINKIMNMQERYNKRTKWNNENLEDAIVSQTFKHGMIRRLGRETESSGIQQEWSHTNTCISERAQRVLGQERWKRNEN